MKKIIVPLCLAIILTSKFVNGKTFYVDNQLSSNCATGNYSIANRTCKGSDGNAYRTVASGISALNSGDTLYIRAGTYKENDNTIPSIPNYTSMTTISAYGSESVTLNNTSSEEYTIRLSDAANNITIQNLNFKGVRAANANSVSIGNSDSPIAGTGYIVVINCHFNGASHCHLKGEYKWWVKNCTFRNVGSRFYNDHHIYSWAPLTQGNEAIYENNYFINDGKMGAAIHLYCNTGVVTPAYHIIRYNIVNSTPTASAWGFLCDANDVTIVNNSVYGTTYGITIQGFNNDTIQNNILDNIHLYPVFFEGGNCSYITVTNNLTDKAQIYWPNLDSGGICDNCTISGNLQSTLPRWLHSPPSAWTDFRLSSSSRAIDTGANLGTSYQNGINPCYTTWPPSTVNQNSCGSGWEIGAFVYMESCGPSAPKSLNID